MTDYGAKIRNQRAATWARYDAKGYHDAADRYDRMADAALREADRFRDLAEVAREKAYGLEDQSYRLEAVSLDVISRGAVSE